MRRFKLVEVSKLEPEQQVVLNIATRPQSPSKSESIVVQGVAGSGKTTIGLHILKQLAERVKDQPEQDRPSLLLLTYIEGWPSTVPIHCAIFPSWLT